MFGVNPTMFETSMNKFGENQRETTNLDRVSRPLFSLGAVWMFLLLVDSAEVKGP
jgi:hypothetical protein